MDDYARSRTLALVEQALDDLAGQEVPTSTLLDCAIRVARLRRDAVDLVWLMMEARAFGATPAKDRAISELQPYFDSYDDLRSHWSKAVDEWIVERSADPTRGETSKLLALSVREMEARLESLREMADDARAGPTMSRADVIELGEARAGILLVRGQVREILARVRSRIHDYLSRVEAEVVVDAMVTSIFEQQREYVDGRLRELAPTALEQLASAYRRRAEGDPEARSHALTSCRRALKSVADSLYPPRPGLAQGSDGVDRPMTGDRYISRLLQFVHESDPGRTAAALLQAQIEELAGKLEALNDLASKGVHAEVSDFEANQAVIQTYLTLGDVLRLADAAEPSSA